MFFEGSALFLNRTKKDNINCYCDKANYNSNVVSQKQFCLPFLHPFFNILLFALFLHLYRSTSNALSYYHIKQISVC